MAHNNGAAWGGLPKPCLPAGKLYSARNNGQCVHPRAAPEVIDDGYIC